MARQTYALVSFGCKVDTSKVVLDVDLWELSRSRLEFLMTARAQCERSVHNHGLHAVVLDVFSDGSVTGLTWDIQMFALGLGVEYFGVTGRADIRWTVVGRQCGLFSKVVPAEGAELTEGFWNEECADDEEGDQRAHQDHAGTNKMAMRNHRRGVYDGGRGNRMI